MATSRVQPVSAPAPPFDARPRFWRRDDTRREAGDAAFRKRVAAIRRRDRDRCCRCGFVAEGEHEIHHIDGDHDNDDPANLTAVCFLCHFSAHLYKCGAKGEAIVVYWPWWGQAALNHLARAVQVGIASGGDIGTAARRFDRAVTAMSMRAGELLGTTDPRELGARLGRLSDDQYGRRDRLLGDFRLWWTGRYLAGPGCEDIAPRLVRGWRIGHPDFAGDDDRWLGVFRDLAERGAPL